MRWATLVCATTAMSGLLVCATTAMSGLRATALRHQSNSLMAAGMPYLAVGRHSEWTRAHEKIGVLPSRHGEPPYNMPLHRLRVKFAMANERGGTKKVQWHGDMQMASRRARLVLLHTSR